MEKNENNLTKEEIQIENMRNDLIEILDKEQKDFKKKMSKFDVETIMDNAYEICIREEIQVYLSNKNYSKEELNCLIKYAKSNSLIDRAYDLWQGISGGFNEDITNSVDETIQEIEKEQKSKQSKSQTR
ncbi:MAG TPA: DUF3848 domain-containing protein [Clostridiaceae bacterium]|nr:DUF3848 domain-containing protein [Clostridiaceae bacterium]